MNLNAVKQIMKKKNIDLMFLANIHHKDPHLYYLTHIESEYTFLFIPKQNKPIIYTSSLEFEQTKQKSIIKNVRQLNKHPSQILKKNIKKHKWRKIGINKSSLTINELNALKKQIKKVQWIDVNKLLYNIRQEKTQEELQCIKKACSVGDKIFDELIKNFKTFKTELDVAEFIERKAKMLGCTTSFPTIVASGKNGAMPHHSPTDAGLNNGFCVLDFGVRYKGYCSDMTRTIYLGKPSEEERSRYQLVLEAIYESKKIIREGLPVRKVDELVRKKFGKLNKHYIHSLGHGLGTEVHEPPGISYKSKEKFRNYMVFTIEPGIYFTSRYGIRVEDDYMLLNNKLLQLTTAAHKLIAIN